MYFDLHSLLHINNGKIRDLFDHPRLKPDLNNLREDAEALGISPDAAQTDQTDVERPRRDVLDRLCFLIRIVHLKTSIELEIERRLTSLLELDER